MNTHSSTESDLSIDSLEEEYERKNSIKSEVTDDNVDTILVPFYDKDVLIKVPKDKKRLKKYENKNNRYKQTQKQDDLQKSYLVNKDKRNSRRTSYLEMFRKQFNLQNYKETKVKHDEIRSLSPEVGDTERESIGEVPNYLPTEFFNTESYNEIYYEKLVQRDHEQYLDNSLEELRFTEDFRSKSPIEIVDNNLRSVSEVTQPRRPLRRTTAEPIQHIKLGGLGADLEKIKPSLERARSLQRYSEKVRMENRVKIYKKSIQTDNEKKNEKDPLTRKRDLAKDVTHKEKVQNTTYLMNKVIEDKTPKLMNAIHCYKSKSANVQKIKERALEKVQLLRSASKKREASISKQNDKKLPDTGKKLEKANYQENKKISAKSLSQSKNNISEMGLNSSRQEVPPVHISFMVNIGGTRPSAALKTLEEKHRMYQEQIRAFNGDQNNK